MNAAMQPPPALADRYRVLARVGMGGTAVVYRCVDLHTQRIVAIKALRSTGPLIPEAAARFQREAHLAATLDHPHIVRVLDYGYTQPIVTTPSPPWAEAASEFIPYLAMEYLYGASLKELARQRAPLPLEWVWRIGEQLCAALAVAHAAGVVHRDVKPQNVMVLDSPIELFCKLTDFGIARQVAGDLTTLTATGQVIGTPDYLSPEQVLGEPGGPSADIYALGIVLYELITGHLPFQADTPLAAASRRMVADPPPLTAYRPETPWPLQEVILLALRRDTAERYADAMEFAQALRWSHERSPITTPGELGGWVLAPRVRAPKAPPPVAPVDTAIESGDDDDPELRATLLRVTTHLPGISPELPNDPQAQAPGPHNAHNAHPPFPGADEFTNLPDLDDWNQRDEEP